MSRKNYIFIFLVILAICRINEASGAAINPFTGEYFPDAGPHGVVSSRTGEFFPSAGGGYVSTRTGQFYPGSGGVMVNTGPTKQQGPDITFDETRRRGSNFNNETVVNEYIPTQKYIVYNKLVNQNSNKNAEYMDPTLKLYYEMIAKQGPRQVYDYTDIPTSYLRRGLEYFYGKEVRQDYVEAARNFRVAAENDNIIAQFMTGYTYYSGKGVSQDYKEAAKWFWYSAKQGNTSAQFMLGYLFYVGKGVPQSYEDGSNWLWHAAEQGNLYSRYFLGYQYQVRAKKNQDFKETAQLLRLAFDRWDFRTEGIYEQVLVNAPGIAEIYKDVAKMCSLAAKQGDASSQYLLATMYEVGAGVPKDADEAAKWYQVAANTEAQEMAAAKDISLTQVVIATKDLDVGSRLDASNIILADWPIDSVPHGALQKIEDAIGLIVVTKVMAGMPLIDEVSDGGETR
jgi:TPR repeat protein